jgi:hypothetical protein
VGRQRYRRPNRHPLPLDSPVSIDVIADPIVTFGERTIDFTPVLNQEFIVFLFARSSRLAIRAPRSGTYVTNHAAGTSGWFI